jgi:4-diphosphocytidyl-2-C-methyl-D-erythritol kinase
MKISTPAKINIALEILGKRPDGFHELATWIIPVGLYDTIEIEPAGESSFVSNVPELEVDPSNLIIRAAELFNWTTSLETPYVIRLKKEIPIGAGLGGGSSDAGATLRLLNRIHNDPIGTQQLHALAATLGSDVPFFVDGRSAWCTGRGEKIEPRDFPESLWVCLFKPGFGVSTGGAYRAYAQLPDDLKRGREIETQWGKLRNDLEQAVLPKYLFLGLMKEWLQRQSDALFALMSGSGSTVFAIVQSQSAGELLRTRFGKEFGEQTWSTVCKLNPPAL